MMLIWMLSWLSSFLLWTSLSLPSKLPFLVLPRSRIPRIPTLTLLFRSSSLNPKRSQNLLLCIPTLPKILTLFFETGNPRFVYGKDSLWEADCGPLEIIELLVSIPSFHFSRHPTCALYEFKLAASLIYIHDRKHVMKIFAYVLPRTLITFLFGLTSQPRLAFNSCLHGHKTGHMRNDTRGQSFLLLDTFHFWLKFEPLHQCWLEESQLGWHPNQGGVRLCHFLHRFNWSFFPFCAVRQNPRIRLGECTWFHPRDVKIGLRPFILLSFNGCIVHSNI